MDTPLPVDEVMAEVRARVRARMRAELARTAPESPLLDESVFAETEALLRRALDHRRHLVLPALLVGDEEWELATSLRWTSHRPRTGALILWVKRRVLLPLTRWLYEYSRENFERQARINDTLMAAVETLAVETVLLRRRLADTAAPAPSGPAQAPAGPTMAAPPAAPPAAP